MVYRAAMTEDFDPSAVPVQDVEVRPVGVDERRGWYARTDLRSLRDLFAQVPDARRHAEPPVKAHGRIDARRVAVRDLLPDTRAPFPQVWQAFRATRERLDARTGDVSTETAYGITSRSADRATPAPLQGWNRGHWPVENANHPRRDATLGEDASRVHARHALANHAALNYIALAVVFHHGFRWLPDAYRHFLKRRQDAFDALLSTR